MKIIVLSLPLIASFGLFALMNATISDVNLAQETLLFNALFTWSLLTSIVLLETPLNQKYGISSRTHKLHYIIAFLSGTFGFSLVLGQYWLMQGSITPELPYAILAFAFYFSVFGSLTGMGLFPWYRLPDQNQTQ